MKLLFFMAAMWMYEAPSFALDQITPYKYTDEDRQKGLPSYGIPESCRCVIERPGFPLSDIVYYMSKPREKSFPLAILCGGSSSRNDAISCIHFHRYFLQEFLDLGIGVITVEQQGIEGSRVDVDLFMEQYTRSARLLDYKAVIDYLKESPPQGWNGKLIFLGVSEGGSLVTALTVHYAAITSATINWCGAGDWSWEEQLWAFIKDLEGTIPWHVKMRMMLPRWFPFSIDFSLPRSREEFDSIMCKVISDPTAQNSFMGMTYKYHADALVNFPAIDYAGICTPFLVVVGGQDSIIQSCDQFVQKAYNAGAPVTYRRVSGMGHYIRHHPEVIAQSFEWLKKHI